MKSEALILMTIAHKATVDFEEYFGYFEAVADQDFDITCNAEKARPVGKFIWKIELPTSEFIELENNLSPKEELGPNGLYKTQEVRFQ